MRESRPEPVRQGPTRRTVLAAGTAATAAIGLATAAAPRARAALGGDPFLLGVTSGDPAPDGFVLWTRTTPAAGTLTSALTMCFASCARWEHGFYTAHRRMAEDDPDLVLHLGDHQYEHGHLGYPVGSGIAREIEGGETFTLADYRQRHALTKTAPDLQLAHSTAPWLVVWDGHEVDNDWAGTRSGATYRGSRSAGGPPSRRTTRTCRCGARRCRKGSTCSSTGASGGAGWPPST